MSAFGIKLTPRPWHTDDGLTAWDLDELMEKAAARSALAAWAAAEAAAWAAADAAARKLFNELVAQLFVE